MSAELKAELGALAKKYGDVALVHACATVVGQFALKGARDSQTQKEGDPAIHCLRCRERDAHARRIEETLKRCTTGRPIGGATPSSENDE